MFRYKAKIKNKFQTYGLREGFKTINEAIEYAKGEQVRKPSNKKFHTIEIYEFWVENGKNKEKLIKTI